MLALLNNGFVNDIRAKGNMFVDKVLFAVAQFRPRPVAVNNQVFFQTVLTLSKLC